MPVKAHRNFHSFFYGDDVVAHFIGKHCSCRIHNCKQIKSGSFKRNSLFGKSICRKNIRLHCRIEAFKSCIFYHFHGSDSIGGFARISAYTEKRETGFFCFFNSIGSCILIKQEHTEFGFGCFSTDNFKISCIIQRSYRRLGFICTQPVGVSKLDSCNSAK